MGGWEGTFGGEGEQQKRARGGGSAVCISTAAVILLLRASTAGGCARGSVEKTEERRTGEKGSAWAALQQLQLQQPVRRKEGKAAEGRKTRLQDCL